MSKTKEYTKNYDKEILDPESFGGEDFPSWFPDYQPPVELHKLSGATGPIGPAWVGGSGATGSMDPAKLMGPIVTPEEESVIKQFYEANPSLKQDPVGVDACSDKVASDLGQPFTKGSFRFNEGDAWIQTYSGRRFNPTNPYVDAIVIQDVAHALSMQCRFSGHVKKFYSVAQHSVLVSHICNFEDALWGLLHDASEAYLVDVPRPLKRSGKFDAYLEFEANMQKAICKRFGLPETEPSSVKKADKILLATEARDLLGNLRSDWTQPCEPLPFKIEPLMPQEAKNLFMKRFFELVNQPLGYAHYLSYEDKA